MLNGGESSTKRNRKSSPAGRQTRNSNNTPTLARKRPARRLRSNSASPTSAIRSGIAGGRISAFSNSFQRNGSSIRCRYAGCDLLTRLVDQVLQMLGWNRVGDPARLGQRRLLGALDENHVDDADHLAGVGFVYRASAVARIRSRVELKHRESAGRESSQRARIEIGGATLRDRDRRDNRNHAAMSCRIGTE